MISQSQIHILKTHTPRAKPQDEMNLPFGRYFTDHMLEMTFSQAHNGWGSPEIKPYGSISFDPAASGLHYGQSIFEGLKCYPTPNGKLQLFRPLDNFRRMNQSARRLMMPEIDPEFVLSALKQLLMIDASWVPKRPGTALYIRPTMIATEPFLGVHPAREYLFYIILSPVGAYFSNGNDLVSIYVEDQLTRAADGGTGSIKSAGNYAGALLAATKAEKLGYSQVLWLDGKEHRWIEEIGAMNIMFRIGDEIVTPALTGSILPGITRDSIIRLCRQKGIPLHERRISIDEVVEAARLGTLSECFGVGTAAVITPIGRIQHKDTCFNIQSNRPGSYCIDLRESLLGIQYGLQPDPFGWIEPVA